MNILPFRMLILHHNQRKNTKKERKKEVIFFLKKKETIFMNFYLEYRFRLNEAYIAWRWGNQSENFRQQENHSIFL